MDQFKHAIVYGRSVKHQPQRVGLSHELADEDISMQQLRSNLYPLCAVSFTITEPIAYKKSVCAVTIIKR